mmetsp:Transcript_881/g.1373  ORF Transcript_881/g.1373 Transcript_881/m.1373 type:complete len:534 (+) Transcript_881:241-1842(+)
MGIFKKSFRFCNSSNVQKSVVVSSPRTIVVDDISTKTPLGRDRSPRQRKMDAEPLDMIQTVGTDGTLGSSCSEDSSKAEEVILETPNNNEDAVTEETMIYSGSEVVATSNRGFPGYLTPSEYNVFTKFRTQVHQRPDEFRSTIYSFGGFESGEEEHYALCRWLRARDYDLKKALRMVEEATAYSKTARENNFYLDPKKALGVETSVYYSIFPELFIGYTKESVPFYITKAGKTDLKHISCVTTMPKMVNFHWHCMVHAFGGRLRKKKTEDPSFQRFEGLNIMDLEGLTLSNAMEAINLLKDLSTLDQLCFPECLNRLIVINAPAAFSAFWAIAKTFIDARTAEKVEIYSSRKARWQKRLLELIPAEELPSDYGGTNSPYSEYFRSFTTDPELVRQFTLPVTVQRATSSFKVKDNIKLAEGECMELIGFTRSSKVGTFTVVAGDKVHQTVRVTHEESEISHEESEISDGYVDLDEPPTCVVFPRLLEGPGKVNSIHLLLWTMIVLSCSLFSPTKVSFFGYKLPLCHFPLALVPS